MKAQVFSLRWKYCERRRVFSLVLKEERVEQCLKSCGSKSEMWAPKHEKVRKPCLAFVLLDFQHAGVRRRALCRRRSVLSMPQGKLRCCGAYPRQPPRGLAVCLGGAHEWVPAWRGVWVLLCSTRCHHGDPSTFAEYSVPSAECLTDCREGACWGHKLCARAVCVLGSVCCCAVLSP